MVIEPSVLSLRSLDTLGRECYLRDLRSYELMATTCTQDARAEEKVEMIGDHADGCGVPLQSFYWDPNHREYRGNFNSVMYVLHQDSRRAFPEYMDLKRLGICA